MTETTALYITFGLGILFSIIGTLIIVIMKQIEGNIKELFKQTKENEDMANAIKLDLVKNYVSKADCREIEIQRNPKKLRHAT